MAKGWNIDPAAFAGLVEDDEVTAENHRHSAAE